MTLHARLRFSPAPELLEIFKACGVSLSQFLCRAITIMTGLIYLSKMCKFTTVVHGRVSCWNNKKWLDFSTRDPSKNWSSSFFFGRLKELQDSPNIGDHEVLKILNFPHTESLQHELHYISGCVMEECLFKVRLSIQVGRSYAIQLKKFEKTPEVKSNVLKRSASHSLEGQKIIGPSFLKKRKINDKVIMSRDGCKYKEVARPPTTNTVSLIQIIIQKMDMESKFESILDDWNDEFVKVKFLQGEYRRRLEAKTKETSILEDQLTECRAELVTISTSLSFQNREADLFRHELIEACAEINQHKETLKKLALEKNALEKENKKLQDHLHERETTTLDIEAISLKAVEEFKKSATYHREIQHLT
ncbi:hypothetical protein IEQ34_022215 [Dendrobium chrysotoxum]|uniref:Uncharacterized protein n=1 Tax=Dendrobium chrysotoxum TaxID=161865 RepID=A0AAV7FYG2_DENCH|nr:hypothetical protein IEQ34_022215 [Dendrobium chrysotoxum]